MHLVIMLKGVADREIAERAARENLWLTPLSGFYADKTIRRGFILGFGSTAANKIPAAVHRLRTCLQMPKPGS